MRKVMVMSFFLLCVCGSGVAQKNELAVVLGAKITPSVGSASNGTQGSVDTTFAFEANYAHRLAHVPSVALHLEFPVAVSPSANVSSATLTSAVSYSTVFFTPLLRLKFGPPGAAAAVWISAGGGLAHFNPSSSGACVAALGFSCPPTLSSTTKGAVQGGAGLDYHPGLMPFAFRVEARDFYTGIPDLGAFPALKVRNNILAGAGIVLRF